MGRTTASASLTGKDLRSRKFNGAILSFLRFHFFQFHFLEAAIQGGQANTQQAVKVIADVSEIIGSINESVTMISTAVEQQTITANEISANVQQTNEGANNIASSIGEVATGANDMSKNAGEAAKGSNEVSANIQGVSLAATQSSVDSRQVDKAAAEFKKMAGILQELVGRFKLSGNTFYPNGASTAGTDFVAYAKPVSDADTEFSGIR